MVVVSIVTSTVLLVMSLSSCWTVAVVLPNSPRTLVTIMCRTEKVEVVWAGSPSQVDAAAGRESSSTAAIRERTWGNLQRRVSNGTWMPRHRLRFNVSRPERTVPPRSSVEVTVRIPGGVPLRAHQLQVLGPAAELPLEPPSLQTQEPFRRAAQPNVEPGEGKAEDGGDDVDESGEGPA